MSENSRFVSDRRTPNQASWDGEADWAEGTTEDVDIINGQVIGRIGTPDQISGGQVLYNEGVNEGSWVEGANGGTEYSPLGGTLTKGADHLFAEVTPNPDDDNIVSWLYNDVIDFSNYTEIIIEAAVQGDGRFDIVLTQEAAFDYNGEYYYDAWYPENYPRQTTTFDISDVSEEYYLHLGAKDASLPSSQNAEAKFYYLGLR